MEGCDVVYHFAAQADINASNDSPLNTIESNIMGTQNVLEVSREIGLKRFIFASTVYVFSDLGSFYRVSKQASEKIIEEYNKQFNLNYTILRYGSLYGARANKFNFISNILIQALNEKIERKGDGKELREYIHVKDAARLSIQALDEEYENQHLIITGHQQIRVKDLLYMIKEIFNNEIEISFGGEKDIHHYQITPYNYKPKIAKKLSPNEYYDLGQGLLEQIYDLSDIFGNKYDNINLRKK